MSTLPDSNSVAPSTSDLAGRILVVDDSQTNCEMLRRRLCRRDYDVECANDGQAALDMIAASEFDLVLLDLMMPGISGLEALERIRQDYSLTQLPVIMVTAKGESQDVVDALSKGANDYVTKPLDFNVGLARIRTQVNLKRTTASLQAEVLERKAAQENLADHARRLQTSNDRLVQAEKELQQSVRELQQKNESLEEFVYVASHDLQEPIRKLVSFAKLLQTDLGDSLDESVANDLAFITTSAHRISTLVKNVRTLAHTDLATAEQAVSLDDCVNAAIDSMSDEIAVSGATIERQSLPCVTGNEVLLVQLFQHLIGNAIKFASLDSPVVEITAVFADSNWAFGVKDNGMGLDVRYADRIFKPFQRLHGRDEFEGTGIGLAICNRVVQRHGGRIWVDSQPGQGAHFQFTLERVHRGPIDSAPINETESCNLPPVSLENQS